MKNSQPQIPSGLPSMFRRKYDSARRREKTVANAYVYSDFLSGISMGEVEDPTTELVTADGQGTGNGAASPNTTYDNIAYTYTNTAKRHNGQLIASFADGHVEARANSSWKLEASVWFNPSCLTSYSDGDKVSSIPDSAGVDGTPINSHSATQATPGNQPVYSANDFNGRPSLKFDGTASILGFPAPSHIYGAVVAAKRTSSAETYPNLIAVFQNSGNLYGFILRYESTYYPQFVVGYAPNGSSSNCAYLWGNAPALNPIKQDYVAAVSSMNIKNRIARYAVNNYNIHYQLSNDPVAITGCDNKGQGRIGSAGWGFFPGYIGDIVLFDHQVDDRIIEDAHSAMLTKYSIK
ncbi:MAG TPA: hypothetical protein VHV83_07030 [Armatimonadota bacterium]|nr:hypothetical protein [Armatimonadota bacterium]